MSIMARLFAIFQIQKKKLSVYAAGVACEGGVCTQYPVAGYQNADGIPANGFTIDIC